MPQAVFRIEKLHTWGHIAATAAHNLRARETPNADPDGQVIEIVPLSVPACEAVRAKIGDQHIRKNAVLAVEVLISASPAYFRPDDPSQAGHFDPVRLAAWRTAMEPWITEYFPHAVSVVLHLDESTPHYQVIDVPLDDLGKLNARAKFGGSIIMRQWQTRAAAPVKKLGIERGVSGSRARHEDIQQFYARINTPLARLVPEIKTPLPSPLPPPTFAEKVPHTAAQKSRQEKEISYAQRSRQHQKETQNRQVAALGIYEQTLAKASIADLAQHQAKEAQDNNIRLAMQLSKAQEEAAQLRALPLSDVLKRMYSGVKALLPTPLPGVECYELAVDGRRVTVSSDGRWIVENLKGRGAINLVMELDGLDFGPAVRLMAESFPARDIEAEHTKRVVDRAKSKVEAALAEPIPVPAPDVGLWSSVRGWLIRVRGFSISFIDWLHRHQLVHADRHGNAVFKREKGGAFVHQTKREYIRKIGSGSCGSFVFLDREGRVIRSGDMSPNAWKKTLRDHPELQPQFSDSPHNSTESAPSPPSLSASDEEK